MAHVAGVDEQDFILSLLPRSSHEPEAGGYLSIEKQLGGQVHDAVDQSGIHQGFAYHVFAAAVAGEGSFRQDKPARPLALRW